MGIMESMNKPASPINFSKIIQRKSLLFIALFLVLITAVGFLSKAKNSAQAKEWVGTLSIAIANIPLTASFCRSWNFFRVRTLGHQARCSIMHSQWGLQWAEMVY